MIVVTGGGGFIGKTLIERLESRTKESILNVDFRIHKKVKTMHPYGFLDKMRIKEFANSVSIIFHNGACSDTTNEDPYYIMKNNFDYSTLLLRRCMEHYTRIIYASSASIYGHSAYFKETDPHDPKNVYGLAKSLFDKYANVFSAHASQIVGLRYFNVFGRNEEHKGDMASVIYKFFKQSSAGKIKLFDGSENFKRDFIHIDDIIDINFFFYENPQLSGIYNAGTGKATSFKDIANIFVDRYGVEIESVPMPERVASHYQTYTCSDNNKLCGDFKDYRPSSLFLGVTKYLDHLENQ